MPYRARTIPRAALPDLPVHGVAKAFALGILFFSGLVDLPRAVQVGPVTSHALLTIGYYLGAAALLVVMPVIELPAPRKTLPMLIFLFWAMASLCWTPAPLNGMQNILAIGALPLLIFVGEAAASTAPEFGTWFLKWLNRSVVLATLIYATSVLLTGAGTNELIGARSYGLYSLLGVAVSLAAWRYGSKLALCWGAFIVALVGVSESRLALGIGIALFPIAQLPTRGIVRWLKVLAVASIVAAASYAALNYFDTLRDRFTKGDVSLTIGTVSINGSGRAAFWNATLDSWEDAPVFGKGAGSAEGLVEEVFVTIKHPHNDYLRILHDYGIFGAALWTVGIGALVAALWRSWRRADKERRQEAQIHLSALLCLAAFIMEMTAENAMVIAYLTAPIGFMVGASFGVERARQRASLAHRGLQMRAA